MTRQVYFAAPLFSVAERTYNESVASELRRVANVFLPQESGLLLVELLSRGMNKREAYAMVFAADWEAIKKSDILIAVLDGAGVDEGVAVEIGLAFGLGIPCVGLKTDWRVQLPTGDNPMVVGALRKICSSVAEVVAEVVT